MSAKYDFFFCPSYTILRIQRIEDKRVESEKVDHSKANSTESTLFANTVKPQWLEHLWDHEN